MWRANWASGRSPSSARAKRSAPTARARAQKGIRRRLHRQRGLHQEDAERLLAAGEADAVAFGKLFIANPDLPRRLALDAPLNKWNAATFFRGAEGYTDYPALAEAAEVSRASGDRLASPSPPALGGDSTPASPSGAAGRAPRSVCAGLDGRQLCSRSTVSIAWAPNCATSQLPSRMRSGDALSHQPSSRPRSAAIQIAAARLNGHRFRPVLGGWRRRPGRRFWRA